MTPKKLPFFVILFFALHIHAQTSQTVLFDEGWRFHLGGMQRCEQPRFDDSKWRKVDLPHDWSIEDRPGTQSPFSPDAISQVSGGFTTGGTGIYRKTFTVSDADKAQRIIIQFDGVYMNADVWVNGENVGNHPYGYTAFWFDVTHAIHYGGTNVITVEVKNEGQNSRWYSGSGIYRHVWLKTLNPTHIALGGISITTPQISATSAAVNINTTVVNQDKNPILVTVATKLLNPLGAVVGKITSEQTIALNQPIVFSQDATVTNPQLWGTETPALYTAVSEIYIGGKLYQRENTTFGIRSISVDAVKGFLLNGQPVKLKGGCFHNDNGPLGSKAYDRAEERKVELLKASGFNAIRCSHNPPTQAFLDACDRNGVLVIDEAFDMWNYGKNPYDYHVYFKDWWQRDIESMVLGGRNHPAVIMWSIGNEIPERGSPEGVATAKMLAIYLKSIDSTRAITSAVNGLGPDKDPYFAQLDVAGYNYAVGGDHGQASIYDNDHKRVQDRVMYCSESYPLEAFGSWMAVIDHPYVIGDFVWTAWDYIGEASIGWLGYWQSGGFYPWNLAYCGDIDICGWKRPQSYYRDALWKSNQLSIFVKPPVASYPANPELQSWSKWNWDDVVHGWNWKGYENKPLQVTIYSSCEKVELFLNGKSQGILPTDRSTKFMATFSVPYQAGELKAVGYNGNKPVNETTLATAALPVKISLTADRKIIHANGQDLCYITVELKDAKGNVNPLAESVVHFSVAGDATIVGVGNANPTSTESYQLPQRKAWKGRCLVILKAGKQGGKITLKASAANLPVASVDVDAVK